MIRKPTVLILGAGASAPYGYPLGGALVERILTLTDSGGAGGPLHRVLIGTFRERLADFHRRLRGSETSSIDDFLESNPDYAELGKLCIAGALTVHGPPLGYPVSPSLHWYKYLWERLRQGAAVSQQFGDNRLRVVTYNYERSLERYFASVLRGTYPDLAKAGPEVSEALRAKAIPVVHLHGALGEIADRVFTVSDRMTLNGLDFYRKVAAGIRIIHEASPTQEYATAHEWLREAQVICFLGFGFHPTNVKRLDLLNQIRGHANVFCGGTALGLEEAELLRAESLLAIGGQILRPGVDALMYLRRYAPLE